jgi:hypothetical protein
MRFTLQITLQRFLLISLTMSAATAVAQSRYKANIPFSFTIRGQSFPSGNYEITPNINNNVILIVSDTFPAKHAYLISRPADPVDKAVVFKFVRRASGYSLRTIQVGQQITGDADRPNKDTVAVPIISSP